MSSLPIVRQRDDTLPHATTVLGVAYRLDTIHRPLRCVTHGRDAAARQKCLAAYQAKPVEFGVGRIGDVCSRYGSEWVPYGYHSEVGEVVDVVIKIDNLTGREGVEPDKHTVGAASCDHGYRAPGEMPPRRVSGGYSVYGGSYVEEDSPGYYG